MWHLRVVSSDHICVGRLVGGLLERQGAEHQDLSLPSGRFVSSSNEGVIH